jgi:hypothetical protein
MYLFGKKNVFWDWFTQEVARRDAFCSVVRAKTPQSTQVHSIRDFGFNSYLGQK